MITPSISLMRCLVREAERRVGSASLIAYYDGEMPGTAEAQATGNKVATTPLPMNFVLEAFVGAEPVPILNARYWRLYDNNGMVMLQGDFIP
jgi:hypothetical protein